MVSFALDLVELVVLVEILFFDKAAFSASPDFGLLHWYFIVMVCATSAQGTGVLLVTRGWFRLGGGLQIVASAAQVFKIDGVIGIVGGVKAWRYPARMDKASELRRQPC